MAYAAASSLYHTIHLLLMSSRTSIISSTEKLLKFAKWEAEKLQTTLEKYDKVKNSSEGVLAVDARIRDEARKLEDLIQSEASAQFLSQSQSHGRFSLNLDHLKHDMACFMGRAEKMRAEYLEELAKNDGEAVVYPAAAVNDHSGGGIDYDNDDVMVGSSDLFLEIRDKIIASERGQYISITGMAGIGKTKFVKKLFHDSLIREKFQYHRAFVRVGQKFELDDILINVLSQLNIDDQKIVMKGKVNVYEYFRNSLKGRKYLIVLDDLWDDKFEFRLRHQSKGVTQIGCILVTSRIDGKRNDRNVYRMSLLDEKESWELLRRKVFGELQDCPSQLVKAGKKIAENCEGLPLLILSVAQLLLKSPRSQEFWDKVARMQNSVFEDAMDQIYEVLLPSYHYLAQRAKACFLYMCVFPKDYVVWRSKVTNLWLAEGFADRVSYVLDDIVSSNLVVIRQLNWSFEKAKACNLHVVYRHLCRREAANNKFIFILQSYVADGLIERMEDMPHLAIYSNTLLAINVVHDSIQKSSNLRSVLCTGPYHQYQVPICLDLKLMRVLDALTVRFYEFPTEVVKLIQLRYLSLTTNASIPPSISKLWFLEYLIVHQHLSIIKRTSVVESSSYVPMEIWDLEQLKHLQIIGRNLPHPRPGNILSNLTQLLDVGVQSCAPVVLESLPKLEKLRIQIVSAPDVAQAMNSFDHIVGLSYLNSLGSVVVNPVLLPKPILPPRFCISNFMSTLQKLSLSGFGYPWEDTIQIAHLPCLRVLKLRCYAFRGEKWEAKPHGFLKLRYLLIEDADLVHWTAADSHLCFPSLNYLAMKNCHKLKEFPLMQYLREIELVDCNPLAETWAKRSYDKCDVRATYSWK